MLKLLLGLRHERRGHVLRRQLLLLNIHRGRQVVAARVGRNVRDQQRLLLAAATAAETDPHKPSAARRVAEAAAERRNALREAALRENAEGNGKHDQGDANIDERLDRRAETLRVIAENHTLLHTTTLDGARARAGAACGTHTLRAIGGLLAASVGNAAARDKRNAANGRLAKNGHIVCAVARALRINAKRACSRKGTRASADKHVENRSAVSGNTVKTRASSHVVAH